MRKLSLAVLLTTLTLSAVAEAHHSFAAEFDSAKPLKVSGVVTKVEWRNPHTYFYVDVEPVGAGKVQNWAMELGSPNALSRRGWTRDSLKVGDVVNVEGAKARDGSLKGNANAVTLASGKRLFSTGAAVN
jgi:Family of unknown function (DUF6152)